MFYSFIIWIEFIQKHTEIKYVFVEVELAKTETNTRNNIMNIS